MRSPLGPLMRHAGLVAALVAAPVAVSLAQLPNASAAAFGMAGNYTAMARGYEAVAWNPANLAMPGRPLFSLGIGVLGGTAGLDPVDVTAFHGFSGRVVDNATKAAWVDQARLSGGERIRIDGGVTPIALSVGPIGLHVGSSLFTNMNLSPDAFEAILFGNAGNSGGQPKTLDFTGTSVRSAAFTTGAVSFALPLPFQLTGGFLRDERAAFAITGKYVVGHGLVVAEDGGSTVDGTDVQLRIPTITVLTDEYDLFASLPTTEYKGNAGSGMAADVSLAWSGGPWKVGMLAENVFNAFKWDTTMLAFRPGTASKDAADSTGFDQREYSNAPQALRDIVAAQKFGPAIALGVSFRPLSSLTLTADMKTYTGGEETIVIGPRSRFGIGAEWRILPFIPLRAGVASVTDGWQAAVGAGLHFLGYELGAATSIRRRGVATESGLMIGVIGIGR
jgi:hypothetical protein